jgi:hypothetical protein
VSATTAGPPPGAVVLWSDRDGWTLVVGTQFVQLIGGGAVIAMGGWHSPYPITAVFLATVPFWIAAVTGSWWLAGRSGSDPAGALALRIRPIDLPLGVAVGAAMQFVVIPIVYVPILRVLHTSPAHLEKVARDLGDSARGTVGTVLFVLMTCLIAPFAEELVFRGVLQRTVGRARPVVGIVVASLVFGLVHWEPLQFTGLVLFGAASGVLVWRTGRLGPGLVAHAAFNASTVIPLLLRR